MSDHTSDSAQSAPPDSTQPAADDAADSDRESLSLSVPSMDCPSCAGKVESSVAKLDGITDIDPRTTSGTLVVGYDPDRTTPEAIRGRVEAAGYEIVDADEPYDPLAIWKSGRAIRTAIGGVLLLVGIVLEWVVPAANPTLATVLGAEIGLDSVAYVLAAAAPGVIILRNGYASARNLSLDIDLLMAGGILGALAVNLPFEAATLAVLFSIAELLERYSMDRARGSLRELMALSPETATVRRDGEEQVVAAETVEIGDRVIVRPGEKIPVDGVIREGNSAIDESPITGESVPADKGPGAEVYAGSLTEAGYIEIEATASAAESTIARVIDLVEAAEGEDTETEQFVDRFAAVYTPIIVAAALLTMTVPPLVVGGPFTEWFVRGLTLLVIACPCAFVISTPVSVVSGLTSAARNGVLIKGGTHLEAMGDVEAVALDKTGTLTTGDLGVTDVLPLNGNTEKDVLACAAALEGRSEHPIADAIVDRAEEAADGTDDRSVEGFEALTGEGVRAELDGITHYAGKPELFADLGFDLDHAHLETDGGLAAGAVDADADGDTDGDADSPVVADEIADCEHGQYLDLLSETIPRLQQAGKTVVLVGTDEELEGLIAIADTVRPEAAWAVERLRANGIERIVMLTGDNERTAHAIGEQVGVDEVRAGLMPEEKVDAVRELREAHPGGVAMVGDGINDAPALATATVGVAMGAAGTDTALETADIALMADDLTRLPYLSVLSTRASGVIRQNIWSSLGVKLLLAVAAPFGYVSVLGAIVVGDMGMSLGVTGNALRLAGVEPEEPPAVED
ncbi:cadmium-translocating P-type ATPase [Halonotius terrestris]|uniref:P-type Cu(+) transporter n=1 Tax=Halonotius terrestris TaxID=2487750 RepID=A0A8J8P954_9EURY|nr:cation-translocating P-type ATPase [Halonotius terrestris]TQQ83338.1 cadmium-translocating P-type ATPase [Halonotius terrestris]